ncbi:PREDICTED: uncharacterized protein LOC109183385 [Ipomoea nil]|uniref:uncharacterized protein LOC109183385 n=1 Tax=Ipomoea nil TaxID=35883 RepID=UPI000901F3C7|nr:PREDICTED: uncharacterized protein LOC109183385 [Ipomoea nil]
MRWHKERRIDDGEYLRHPADSKAWKDFDQEFPWFANDARNVRLGLASDGFNPFGNMDNSYGMWPVILIPYNLPPWMCMKDPFFMLTLLIPGPKAPGRDIDVYLQPLIEDLIELLEIGVTTYDACSLTNFQLHASIMWTINDFSTHGNLSGWSTKGYMACPVCNDDPCSVRLRSKLGYIGHRRFLPTNHTWRRSKKFNGKVESRSAPLELSGEDVLRQLHEISDSPFGKHPNKRKRKQNLEDLNWCKKSIFFKLPYWEKLKLRHNLDVMHIEKNICDNIIGTLLNIDGKNNDTLKARQDLDDMNIRKELHLVKKSNGSYEVPHPCYMLTREERLKFAEFLKFIKFPDGYASNISRCVNADGKLMGLKSHDCHVLLQRVLPVGVRGSLEKEVTTVLSELGDFFRKLCCKTLKLADLDVLRNDIVIILCKFEMIYPPAFFDVMVHLAIHLPQEAALGGPVQFRWMFMIERFLGSLKHYVRNKAHPERSIAEGYVANECLTFLSLYLNGVETRFNKPDRNNDRQETHDGLSIFSHKVRSFGAWNYEKLTKEELNKVEWGLLEKGSLTNVNDRHKMKFPKWFREKVFQLHNAHATKAMDDLYSLACGPQLCVRKYASCIVNGVRFHTKDRDSRHKTQNCGISVQGNHENELIDFYGVLNDVIELEYIKGYRIVLFKCDWFDIGKRSFIQHDGIFTSIKVSSFWYKNDPYVLASQAKQVFYLNDPKFGLNWRVVQQFQHRHIYDENEVDSIPDDKDDTLDNNDVYQDNEMVSSNGITVGLSDDISTSLHRVDVESHIVKAIIVPSERIEVEEDFVISDDEDESPIEYDSNEEEMNDDSDEIEDS